MKDDERIPEVTELRQNYDGSTTLKVLPEVLLCFPRSERKKLLHSEVERLLLMLDWEERRKEVADYVQSKED